ncbi:Apolipoprotein N-acyltransferase [Aquicella siphonis]|uniref:Apolipoprotein N-acyltransferase n=1 Tax=Aquicella siphonis TaxID=254247 RepID=A0A5E4PIM5_9COXI|nr:apolipoprotein N-acyltransferase [Aquicella siphonis]VVC76232.1 Apolipoprotein N-acyltransferase [Aquicella siphonis]
MNKPLAILQDSIMAILLGVALTFAFAPYEVFPLAVIAPAGLLAIWLRTSASLSRTFWAGFCFGLGMFGAGVYWVFTSIHVFGGVPAPFAVIITIGMIAILALFPAAVGYFTNRYFPLNHTAKLIYAFPAIWVLSEWVRSWLFTGFPWLFLGYSQTSSPLRGYAPVLSVYFVSLTVLLSSGLIVNAVIQYKKKQFKPLYLNLLALALIWILGGLLSLIPWTKPQGEPLSVAMVQGNIPQSIKWSPEHLQLSFDRYSELTGPLWGKYNLIIWPEAAVPLPLQSAEPFIDSMDQKARDSHSTLLLGIPIRAEDGSGYFNAIVTLGKNKQVYLKRHLVPFGEYTPLSKFFANALQFMNIPMSDMLPGKFLQPPLTAGDTKILASICYEIAFPQLTRSRDKSIGMLLVATNDAWFGESNAEPQHLQMAAMRAIEFGKPVLFVSNDGITAIINPDGRVETAAPQRQTAVLTGSVQPMYGITPWLKNGMDPMLFLLVCMIYAAVRAKRREMPSPPEQKTRQHKRSKTNT